MDPVFVGILICGAIGALGGFLGRVVPNGVKQEKVKGAPVEAGPWVSGLLGAVAAVVLLVGTEPLASAALFPSQTPEPKAAAFVLVWSQVVSSFVVGLGGVGWLIATQNTKTLKTAVAEAAAKPPDSHVAAVALGFPRDTLQAVRDSRQRG